MIPIQWSERANIRNLPELLKKVREQGGSIVEYQRVFSVIVYSESSPVYEWVGPDQSRLWAGINHTLFTFAFGWWSAFGLFTTLPVVVNNLMGGTDVTEIMIKPPPLPGASYDTRALEELISNQRRQGIITLVCVALVVGILISFIVRECGTRHPQGRYTIYRVSIIEVFDS